MRKIGTILVTILATVAYLRADTLTLFFNQNATDNLFQTAYSLSDHVSSLGFSLDKDLGGISLFAEGNFSYLYENPDLTFYVQDVGLDHVWVVGKTSGLYLSLTGRGAFYRSDFSDFNYGALNAYGAFKSYLTPTSILKADYTLTVRDYRWSQFDHFSQALNVTMDKFFQTRTTLKAGLGWGIKHYFHPYSEDSIPEVDGGILSDQALIRDVNLGMGPGSGAGPEGGGNQDMNQEGGGGGGPGADQGKGQGRPTGSGSLTSSLPQTSPTSSSQKSQGIHTLALNALIAQGLSDRLGVQVSGVKQWPLYGENPFLYVWEFYMVENPFYDRFSWIGHELGAQITYLLPGDIQAQLGYGYSRKEFPGVEVLDEEGNATGLGREDSRHSARVKLSKDFHRFSLMLTYNFINNGSNDPLFEWQGNLFALGIEWNLYFGDRK
jgi:hypothetical protein